MSARSPRPSRFCASTPATKDAEPTHALFQSRQDKRVRRGLDKRHILQRGNSGKHTHTLFPPTPSHREDARLLRSPPQRRPTLPPLPTTDSSPPPPPQGTFEPLPTAFDRFRKQPRSSPLALAVLRPTATIFRHQQTDPRDASRVRRSARPPPFTHVLSLSLSPQTTDTTCKGGPEAFVSARRCAAILRNPTSSSLAPTTPKTHNKNTQDQLPLVARLPCDERRSPQK